MQSTTCWSLRQGGLYLSLRENNNPREEKFKDMTCPRSSMPRVLGIAVFLLMTFCYGYAQDDNACSNKSLKGSFGFRITGTNGAVGPFAFVGHFVADGEGNITGAGTEAILPVVGRNQPFAATYTVNADCTGSAVLTFTSPDAHSSARLDFVLVDDGKEIMLIDTDRGTVESGVARKQFSRQGPAGSDRD